MSKIAIDARVINSGTGTYAVKLLEYLQTLDSTNQYIVLVPTKDLSYWQPTAKNFHLTACDFKNYSLAEQVGFKKFLERLHPDLVHFLMPQQPIFYRGKRVTTVHDMTLLKTYNSDKNWLVFHLKQLVGRYVFRRVARISNHVIAISKNTKNEFQQFTHVDDSKISVIYEAAEKAKGDLKKYDVPFKKYIIYVGQQPDYKNIRRLGEAHQKLLRKHPGLGLVLVGRMNEDTKRNHAYFEAKKYKNIHFTGFIDDNQRDYLLTHAEAYVFPSLMEGFGLPPLEAMTYDTPVVSSHASCMPEILGAGAEYFDPKNSDEIAAAIERVITDKNLREQMVERGKKQVAKYSWSKMARETHAIYMQILKK